MVPVAWVKVSGLLYHTYKNTLTIEYVLEMSNWFFYLSMIALLENCQSGTASFLLIRCPHRSMEEVSINTAVETLNVGEEERVGMGGGQINTVMTMTERRRGRQLQWHVQTGNPDVQCHRNHRQQVPLPHNQQRQTATIVVIVIGLLVIIFALVAVGGRRHPTALAPPAACCHCHCCKITDTTWQRVQDTLNKPAPTRSPVPNVPHIRPTPPQILE